jgi:glycosyltransferase involved in cell wall biosynthesis
MKKILIASVFAAPYRTAIFKEISEKYNITVVFDRNKDKNRDSSWFTANLNYKSVFCENKSGKRELKILVNSLSDFDLIIIYDYYTYSGIKILLAAIKNKIPYILNCDGAFLKRFDIRKYFKKFFVRNASAYFSSGKHSSDYFLSYGAEISKIKIHAFTSLASIDILNQPPSNEKKTDLRHLYGLSNKITIVLCIAQFTHRKGIDVLLDAAKKTSGDIEYLIIGGGELKTDYELYIKKNSLSNVQILDYKTKDVLFRYFQLSDIFVLPTREDIWGLVINEAMANGLPVITTDKCIAGLELVENDINGYIVPVGDSDSIANKITFLSQNENLRQKMAKNNLRKIASSTIENMARSQLEVISEILDSGNNIK